MLGGNEMEGLVNANINNEKARCELYQPLISDSEAVKYEYHGVNFANPVDNSPRPLTAVELGAVVDKLEASIIPLLKEYL